MTHKFSEKFPGLPLDARKLIDAFEVMVNIATERGELKFNIMPEVTVTIAIKGATFNSESIRNVIKHLEIYAEYFPKPDDTKISSLNELVDKLDASWKANNIQSCMKGEANENL